MDQLTPREVNTYLNNMTIEGLRQLAKQLLLYPDTTDIFIRAAKETHRAYSFPVLE